MVRILIFISFLVFSCKRKDNHNIDGLKSTKGITALSIVKKATDTITNWQLYKDSELLFKSNIIESNRYTAKIKKSDAYKSLTLKLFSDCNNDIINREIVLALNDKRFATFRNENTVRSPFPIEKHIIDRIRMVKPKETFEIIYSDPYFKNGISIGFLELTEE
ncbi:MAG: hypothetical protein CMO82_01410 [Winogradskyella sp.]|uniref:Lipoprotein n=1 Tax=Winogradskyella poriferorum TaxID=307627 RepID=A0ABU7W390_9FLAO|nr:hypothetical protein [Winogradskyella sp.]|tara:strand:- start:395 stop:883 length:489 start_codon:yes stop_codon:yes gene_type:complete